jgi:hypothetical protein
MSKKLAQDWLSAKGERPDLMKKAFCDSCGYSVKSLNRALAHGSQPKKTTITNLEAEDLGLETKVYIQGKSLIAWT